MNKAELIEAIASESGLSKADAKRALDGFLHATTTALRAGSEATWERFGSFSISKRSARTGRNPRSDPQSDSTPETTVQFKCADELSAALDLVPGAGDERRLGARRHDAPRREAAGTVIDAERLARASHVSIKTAEEFLKGLYTATTKALKKGDRLSMAGFGSFSISKRSARTGRNPQTGKEIQIAAKNVVKFKAGAELSKAVN